MKRRVVPIEEAIERIGTNFSMVERPVVNISRCQFPAITAAVLKTATEGGAVRIELKGLDVVVLRNSLYHIAKRKQLLARTQRDGDALIAWMKKA